jgi:hypothetical protein
MRFIPSALIFRFAFGASGVTGEGGGSLSVLAFAHVDRLGQRLTCAAVAGSLGEHIGIAGLEAVEVVSHVPSFGRGRGFSKNTYDIYAD